MNNISHTQSKKMLCFILLLTVSSILVTIVGAITYVYELGKLIL
jgi:hypothetical protein